MKRNILKSVSFLLCLLFFTQIVFADGSNIDGGGGGLGTGSNSNGWVVTSQGGGNLYDAEGFRVYLVNSSTGVPVSESVDLTNFDIAKYSVYNGQGKTKYEYYHINDTLITTPTYNYTRVNTSPQHLPNIIPWDENSNIARIDTMKDWFFTGNYSDWVLAQLGTNINAVRAGGYYLGIEPIAYFRYNGYNYAMTATEATLFDEITGGDLRAKLGPLTHKNLPLAIFLETAEFTGVGTIEPWMGSRTAAASNADIKKYLGIGYIHYSPAPVEEIEGEDSFSYPTNTWVITSFRLCNIRRIGSVWLSSDDITSYSPATAQINVNGTNYRISNVYIPAGSEQLVWVKWKTPSTPQNLTITASSDKGLYYNEQNSGSSDRYANTIIADVRIYDNDMEKEPPDPKINDTPKSSWTITNLMKEVYVSANMGTTSWLVWDCSLNSEGQYSYRKINYTAEIRNSYIRIKPDSRCPTSYTKNYSTYMKSGYGIEIEMESYLRVTVKNERTSTTTYNSYYSAGSTSYVCAPQYFFCYFPEFEYVTLNRQLELINNKYVFRKNRFSTYNDRNHYTPVWYPDDKEYSVLGRSRFAYTPAGSMSLWTESNSIVIQGNLYDDWRISPIKAN